MKKFLALMLALAMVFALAACNNNNGPAQSGNQNSTLAMADAKVAMITDSGDITDQSFNQTTYEACKEYCERVGITFKYFKPAGPTDADREAMMDAAIGEGFNIIVVPGFLFGPALQTVVPNNPDTKFVALDVSAYDLGPLGENVPANLYSAVYQEELCGYMAGYAAVKLGYTKLGFLGGQAVPAVMRYGYGYVQGADAAAQELGNTSEVSVRYIYGDQFFGDPDITARMDTWYNGGTEVVFACGGSIYASAAEAAARYNKKVIGVDVDQAGILDGDYGAGMTVTSAMKGLKATVIDTLADTIENGNWSKYGGSVATLGLVSGTDPEANYVQIPMGSTQWAEGKFTQENYKTLVKAMFDGTVKVSDDVSVDSPAKLADANDPGYLGLKINIDYQGSVKG